MILLNEKTHIKFKIYFIGLEKTADFAFQEYFVPNGLSK